MRTTALVLAAAALVQPTPAAAVVGDSPGNVWWLDQQAFQSSLLSTTDLFRSEHGAGLVRWNATLAAFAAWYVDGHDCAFRHSGGPFGENLAYGYATPAATVAAWANERVLYDYGRPSYSPATGHFTQLVWRRTTDVGCARRWCGAQMQWLLACEYWPRGNIYGQFGDNVGRRIR
ncbi:hypothetical protein CDD83_10022 [Cordyceps sp. RAO-2017]|nr:hypothetical protein CDD83_10022 [Cordyceps sp. RAO-2017]